jgi:hypothetical protein
MLPKAMKKWIQNSFRIKKMRAIKTKRKKKCLIMNKWISKSAET